MMEIKFTNCEWTEANQEQAEGRFNRKMKFTTEQLASLICSAMFLGLAIALIALSYFLDIR